MLFKLKKELEEILKNNENKNFEADIIISHVTKLSKEEWLFKKEIKPKIIKKCKKLAERRRKGTPLQYLIKNWEFYGVPIKVGKGVLIPRQDTEILVEKCLNLIETKDVVLELGTGSGCISAAIAKNKKNVKIFAIEKYFKALKFAKKNLKPFKNVVKLIRGDILNEKFAKKFKNINLLVSNPPYLTKKDVENLQKEVSFEPFNSLYGGEDGLNYYKKICSNWKNSLKKDAHIIFEIGALQKSSVEKILKENGFHNIITYKDLNNKDRVVVGKF